MTVFPHVPWLSYEDVRRSADSFLEKYHPSRSFPIPIEEIVEFELGLSIDPLPGLQGIDVDGFLYSDLSTIVVDAGIFEHVNSARYRFTLAHEIGHLVLHPQIYQEYNVQSIKGYLEFVKNFPQYLLDRAEFQAYCFAGLVLVPAEPLRCEVKRVTKEVTEILSKLPNNKVGQLAERADLLRDIIEKEVAKIFEVSQPVISKRIGYDKLDLDRIITEEIENLGL